MNLVSMVCKALPHSWKLKQLAKCINSKHEIKPCPNYIGVQQSLQCKLKARVLHLLENEKIRVTDVLQVKLSGDGTKICRKLTLLLLCSMRRILQCLPSAITP